jgi:hypothetical protein
MGAKVQKINQTARLINQLGYKTVICPSCILKIGC